tara:strand:- start:2121 stop:2900 length:780 start_codon:yes stop_codon:yes gene_type:complete
MKITASQFPVTADIDNNLEQIINMLESNPDSDWLLTPEGSLSGYCHNVTHEVKDENVKNNYFKALEKLEKYLLDNKRSIALGTGHWEQDGFPYNQIRYYYNGQLITAYNKQQLTRTTQGLGEYYYYLAGHQNVILEIAQDFPVAGLLCNDAWAFPGASPDGDPYLWKELGDCKAVFVASNCAIDTHSEVVYDWHDSHLRMWATTNNQYVVSSTSTTDMVGGEISKVQAPAGIVGPDGVWIQKCSDLATVDSVTVEIPNG